MARLGKLRWRNRLKCDGEIGCFYSSANNVEPVLRSGQDRAPAGEASGDCGYVRGAGFYGEG